MSLQIELDEFYRKSGFGPVDGPRPCTVKVYTGCMLVPLPNIETRRIFLKYHDLHHMMTGYSVGRIGEGEVSAWELGTGSFFRSPILGIMNLIALSTGLLLKPKRMWVAFKRGCASRNLYARATRSAIDAGHYLDLHSLKNTHLDVVKDNIPTFIRYLEFFAYCSLAMAIHGVLVVPALLLRLITDIGLGYTFFESIKPKKRPDVF